MNTSWITVVPVVLAIHMGAAWAAGDIAAGEAKAANCAGCHGQAGEGVGQNPCLAGMPAEEHFAILQAYKDGSREGAMMQMFAKQLSEADMRDIAAYYESLGK